MKLFRKFTAFFLVLEIDFKSLTCRCIKTSRYFKNGVFKSKFSFGEILCYHLFAMNSTVIHGISAKIFLSESENFPLSSKFHPRKREFSFPRIENANRFLNCQKRILVFEDGILRKGENSHFLIKKFWQKYRVLR